VSGDQERGSDTLGLAQVVVGPRGSGCGVLAFVDPGTASMIYYLVVAAAVAASLVLLRRWSR
jgi:hypothetical protein